MAQTLIQPKASLSKPAGKTGRIGCQVNGTRISSSNPIHWYQQKPGQSLTRMLYFTDSTTWDEGFGNSYKIEKNTDSEFYLIIERLTAEQSATYYCAYWLYTACNINTNSAQKAECVPDPETSSSSTTSSPRARCWGPNQRVAFRGAVGEGCKQTHKHTGGAAEGY